MLRRIRQLVVQPRQSHASAEFRRRRPDIAEVIDAVLARRLTYLSAGALEDLADAVADTEAASLPGAIVEAGTALGGSAVVLGAAKSTERPLLLFDVFGTIPPPSARDGADVRQRYERIARGEAVGIGGDDYYGYRSNLRGDVERNLESFGLDRQRNNIRFIEGLYQDTMPVGEPVALAHLDCDWYESVSTCLAGVEPTLSIGGRFVIDDYDAWSGCRTAVDEFVAEPHAHHYRIERHSRVHLVCEA
jgi:O-methyltransferase